MNNNTTHSEFVKYLMSLAPEGETLLLVRQKAHRKGYVWPAMLPTVKIRPDWAVYANTASFILAKFPPGLPISAAAANATHCLFLVLDDVGTKSKASPLPPTWIIETSPGNFQWGYVFAEQPTTGEFSAAIRAIAAAGYTDGGAINPVRNVRIPGSINLKQGRDNFASVLVEFHPDREFTLTDICDALGVVPGEADRPAHLPVLVDDGADDVLGWLHSQGLVLTGVNPAGWAGVVCPNAAAHSDGHIEGRYLPASRAFTCLHEHCTEWDSERFLEWVETSGGPAHQSGLRSDLLAQTMSGALAKLVPTPAFPDPVAEIVAEVDQRQLGREQKEQLHERWAYLIGSDAFFDMIDRRVVTRQAFNAVYRHLDCKRGKARIEAGVWFDQQRDVKGARILQGVTYASGDSALCAMEGDVYGNTWRDARQPGSSGDPGVWLDHCAHLIPDSAERNHVFDCLAYKLQNPRGKINHAILHASLQGCGKDSLYAPFLWAIGDRNHTAISSDMLHSSFNPYLEKEVYFIQELKQTDSGDRRALENRLKNLIAAPPEFIQCNKKNQPPVSVVNRGFVLCTSNERDAIALPSTDRRWFVIWSDCARMTTEEGIRLWAWYNAGGFAAVAGWLYRRDVAAFAAGATPPHTEAKSLLCEQSLNGAEAFLVDQIASRRGDFAAGVVGGPFYSLLDRLAGSAPAGTKLYPAALFHAFAEAGWSDLGRVRSVELNYKRVFCAPERRAEPRSDLRRACEVAPAPIMSLVKTAP